MRVDALFGAESHGPRDRIVDRRHDLHTFTVAVVDRVVRQVYSRRWVECFAELKDERRMPVDYGSELRGHHTQLSRPAFVGVGEVAEARLTFGGQR